MLLTDITVEVRDISLNRIGVIRPEDLDLKANEVFNGTGAWTLTLAANHPLTPTLRTAGSGIIVTGPTDVLFSGPVVKPESAYTPDNLGGTVTFEGITDDVILEDALSFPQPSNADPTTQNVAWDTRTGNIETLLHAYVNANIGPSAPAARRKAGLIMGTNGGRGPTITKKPRFPQLANLLTDLAALAGLGYRVVQRNNNLVFETYLPTDRSATIRLDTRNGGISGQRVAITPPKATRIIIAGQEEGVNRQFIQRDNATSIAAEAEWGRRIERFLDQRQTNVVAELQSAGDEVLAEDGFTGVVAQVVVADDTLMRFGVDWFLGDKVSVVVENQELSSYVTGMALQADKDGFKLGIVIGDVTGFNRFAKTDKRFTSLETRVSQIESNAESPKNLVKTDGSGNVTVAGTVTSTGALTASAGASVTGNATVSGTLTVAGNPVPFAMAAGTVSLAGTSVASGGAVNVAITFPTGRFSVAPHVMATVNGAPSGSAFVVVRVLSVTATGANIYLYNAGSAAATWASFPISWVATQMTSGAASG